MSRLFQYLAYRPGADPGGEGGAENSLPKLSESGGGGQGTPPGSAPGPWPIFYSGFSQAQGPSSGKKTHGGGGGGGGAIRNPKNPGIDFYSGFRENLSRGGGVHSNS